MKNLKRFSLIILLLGCVNLVYAQTGTIRGTVIEDATGEPLPGVNVLVKGTSKGASTDIDGDFEINIAEGTYALRLSYISFQTQTIEGVQVMVDEINTLGTIRLQQSSQELEEVVVTASALQDSEAALITKKRKVPNFIDGISAETIGKSGISKASEALKKVTGVSVEGGKYVYVRGLGDRYTKTTLNSVDIPSLDPNKNSVQVDIFPTALVDNLVISKTAVAEMPASFTGGIVNIQTKDFPEAPIYEVSASIGYNPSMHFNGDYLTYDGSDTDFLGFDNGARELPAGAENEDIPTPISGDSDQAVNDFVNRFNPILAPRSDTNLLDYSLGLSLGNQYNLGNGDKLGYIFSGTYRISTKHYSNYRLGEYQTQTDPNETQLIYATRQNGVLSSRSVLLGGLAGLAYKTDNSKYRLTGMHLQNGESKASNFFVDNSQSAPGQSGYTGDAYNLEYAERGITNILLNGTHFFDNSTWEIDWKISPTFSNIVDPDIRNTTYTLSQTGGAPRFSAGAGGFPSRLWRYLDEVNLVGRADVIRQYQLFGNDASFKVGASHVYKQRDYEILSYGLKFFGSQPEWTGNPDEVLNNGNLYPNGPIYYDSGNADPNPNAYSSNVNNTAAYISNEFMPVTDLKASVGLRVENYVQRHTGRDVLFAQGGGGNNLDDEKVLDALDFFPSANLTYYLSERMNLRASYSRTIARPSFKELSFAQILDPVSDRIFNGGLFAIGEWDGNLGETRINNFDLRWEMFFNRGQLLSLSLFYKTFEDPIELVRIQAQPTSTEYQPRNVGNGEVFGAEFELRKSFDFISPALTHFGFNTNVTVVKSVIDMTEQEYQARLSRIKIGQDIDDQRQMAGQAPYIINAGLTYDRPEIGLDAGFFYNMKGETLTIVGGGLFPDVYSEPFHSLNFNLNKSLGNASLSLNVDNILNDTQEESYQAYEAEDQTFTRFNPGRSISLGIKYGF